MEECRKRLQNNYLSEHHAHGMFSWNCRKMCHIGILLFAICSSIHVANGSLTGWTDRPTNMYFEKGSRIRIKCTVDSDKDFTNRLSFFNQSKRIEDKYINIINTTTIELDLPKVPEQETKFICKLDNEQGIDYNEVKVGHKPDLIEKINCYSDNWVNMTCTFDKPYNPVTVQYDLKYKTKDSNQIHNCNQPDQRDPKLFSCEISQQSYRFAANHYVILLSAVNQLGNSSQTFDIDNFASVIPDRPQNLVPADVQSDKVTISWTAPNRLAIFPKSFDFEFRINSSCNPNGKSKIITDYRDVPATENGIARTFSYQIPLDYAYTWYDIEIRMKVHKAENVEKMWSKWAKIQVKSIGRRPDEPPEVDTGSFNINNDNNDIYIYWKLLPKCKWNGENFNYVITAGKDLIEPSEFKGEYAVYRNSDYKSRIDPNVNTVISIRSKNHLGLSPRASEIMIPKRTSLIGRPAKIKKNYINGTYHLTWSPPESYDVNIISYTVFWCTTKTELRNNCEGSINFVTKDKNERTFEYPSNETISFAIAAHSNNSTSDMFWAKCTTASNNEIGKINTVYIPRLTSTEIDVEWSLECTDSGIVSGYEIEYCRIKDPKTLDCLDSEEKVNITSVDKTRYTIEKLTPYTTYRIVIRMFSNSTMGPPSEKLANTTLEDAPSEVRELIARNIRNTSVDLYWIPPEHHNGVLLSYEIHANYTAFSGKIEIPSESPNADKKSTTNSDRKNFTMHDLQPYTTYDIVVQACTNKCSVAARTLITTMSGRPGNITAQPIIQPTGTKEHGNTSYSSGIIKWEKPNIPGGELNFFQLRSIFTESDGTVHTEEIMYLKSTECYMDKVCTNNMTGTHSFEVRAVNFILTPHASNKNVTIKGSNAKTPICKNDSHLIESLDEIRKVDHYGHIMEGAWSAKVLQNCQTISRGPSHQYILILCLMTASFVFVGAVFYLYRKIKDMKDILVAMPPGLEDLAIDKMKKGKDVLSMDKKPDILRNVDHNQFINLEDEHGQLLRKSLNGSLNGNDCSSSLHSESSRSENEAMDMTDDIQYSDFGRQHKMSDIEHDITSDNRKSELLLRSPTSESKEMTPILISSASISASTPVVEKYPKPNIIMNPKMMSPMVSSGYVAAPPTIHSTPNVPVNSGYVTHSMFNPMQSSGYTQLNAFGQPILNNDQRRLMDKMNIKTPIVATTDQEGISGYVTHKQLSDFGHRMQ